MTTSVWLGRNQESSAGPYPSRTSARLDSEICETRERSHGHAAHTGSRTA